MNTLAEKMKPFSPKDLPKQKPGSTILNLFNLKNLNIWKSYLCTAEFHEIYESDPNAEIKPTYVEISMYYVEITP